MNIPHGPEHFEDQVRYVKAPARSSTADTAGVVDLVTEILNAVHVRGDAAIREYSLRFDKADLERFEVLPKEREQAVAALDPQTREDTEFAIANVRRFAEAQFATILPLEIEALPGLHLDHRVIPIERVGAYVPGGRFPLLSAPIMTIVPGDQLPDVRFDSSLPDALRKQESFGGSRREDRGRESMLG